MMLKVLRSTVCVAVLLAPALVAAQTPAPTPEEIKASANPELIGDMTKEMGITVPQASGAAGALFGLAKTRLKAEDFTKVASAVPGIDSLMAAAPAVAGTSGSAATGALSKATGAAGALGGLASVAPAFDKLGLKPEMAAKAVPILTNYVTKTGGKEVASLLAGVLK
jgi:Protein of unknown function VcgC/VcgE (DUF2780)